MMTYVYTTGHIEQAWKLPKGSVRRDIHRGKLAATKSGNQWLIEPEAAEQTYGQRPVSGFYMYDKDPSGILFMIDMNEVETQWQHMMAAFYPEPFISLSEFTDDCKYLDLDDVAADENLRLSLIQYRDLLHPALDRAVAPLLD